MERHFFLLFCLVIYVSAGEFPFSSDDDEYWIIDGRKVFKDLWRIVGRHYYAHMGHSVLFSCVGGAVWQDRSNDASLIYNYYFAPQSQTKFIKMVVNLDAEEILRETKYFDRLGDFGDRLSGQFGTKSAAHPCLHSLRIDHLQASDERLYEGELYGYLPDFYSNVHFRLILQEDTGVILTRQGSGDVQLEDRDKFTASCKLIVIHTILIKQIVRNMHFLFEKTCSSTNLISVFILRG